MMGLEIAYLSSADHVWDLLLAFGLKQHNTQAVVAAAAELLEPPVSREEVISVAGQFFSSRAGLVPDGLEGLPSCWLQQLPQLLSCRDMRPYLLSRLSFERGILRIVSAQEKTSESHRFTMWESLRLMLNLCLVPNLWRPLTRGEELEIWNRRPELRWELFTVRG
jgi:hypothetical protein